MSAPERPDRSCQFRHSSHTESSPTPTGKTFLEWIEKYRTRNPGRIGVPIRLQEQYWIRAAKANNDREMLDAINAVRIKHGLNPIRM